METKSVFTILVNAKRQILTLRYRAFNFGSYPPPLEMMKGRYELRNFGSIDGIKIRIAIVGNFDLEDFSIPGCQMTDIESFICCHSDDDLVVQTLKRGFSSYYL